MHLPNPLTALLFLLTSAFPLTTALYDWDPVLRVYNIGQVPANSVKTPRAAAKTMGACGASDIPEGRMGCGNFGTYGSGIYVCKNGVLKLKEVCLWSNGGDGQCVRNQRRKGKKFYVFESGKKVVCVDKKAAFG